MAMAGWLGASLVGCDASSADGGAAAADTTSKRLGFEPVPASSEDTVIVPPGYRAQVFARWGEPISGSYPAFAVHNTGAEQGMQMGMHHDGMHFFPIDGEDPRRGSSTDGLLVVNHEYVEPRLMHAAARGMALAALDAPVGEDGARDPDQVLKEINAHGVSIVRARRGEDGSWALVRDERNRRITGLTPMAFGGPLRGDDRLTTKYSPDGMTTRGTLANCAHGVTPWNTFLTCEENWWYYFANSAELPESQRRYGVGRQNPFRWHLAGPHGDEYARFDATPRGSSAREDYRNEPHGFGWIVEIDPFDPQSTPVKQTHLGRFFHETAVFAPAIEGRPIVVYCGDDSEGEYIYKFVSARAYARATADGSLLDEGTLYAARFDSDGSGEWLALVPGENGLAAETGFATLADILLNTRGAADVAGATRMDRPEWGAVDPVSGTVYFTLTNGANRTAAQAGGANPRANNVFGHIVRWDEADGDASATRFRWSVFALAGDEKQGRDLHGRPLSERNVFAMPDGLYFDADRRLWIQTDIPEADQNRGRYLRIGNNALLAADPETGEIRRFMTGPIGQEITGCVGTPDQRTLFVCVQHPGGAVTSAAEFAAGKLASHWPDGGAALPRSAIVAITKEDGGKVGT